MMADAYDPLTPAPREGREDADRRKFIESDQQREDVRWLMADARGRRLMHSWLEFCGTRRVSMTGNSYTFFNDGMRNVGLMLEGNVLEHAPEQWLKMVEEARAVRTVREQQKAKR